MKSILKEIKKQKFWSLILLLLIIGLGGFVRIYNLDQNPPGISNQEASLGLEAINELENHNLSLMEVWKNNWENLHLNSLALVIDFLGSDIVYLRLISVFFSILTLIGFYLLLKELRFSKLSSLLGTFILSVSFWHLNFSRIISDIIFIPFFLVWLIYIFLLATKKSNYWLFLFGGLFLGMGFYFNLKVGLIFLALIPLILFYIFFQVDFWKNYWKKIGLFLISSLIIGLPLFFKASTDFKQNISEKNTSLSTFTDGVTLHLNSFYFKGDLNQQHNQAGEPLVPSVWAVLFTIGLALSFKEIIYTIAHHKERSFSDPLFKISLLAQGIFWTMLLPGFYATGNIPDSSKIIGSLIAIIIFILIPFEYILRLRENIQQSENFSLKPWRWKILNLSLIGLIFLIFLSGITNLYTYHFVWDNEIKTVEVFNRKLFEYGKIIKKQTLTEKNILVFPDKFTLEGDNSNSELEIIEMIGYPEIKAFEFENSLKALENLNDCKNSTYIFFENNSWLIEEFKKACPNFEVQKTKPLNNYYEFWVLKN